jgi:hypothetical protein
MYATRCLQLLFIALVGVCAVLASHNAGNADPYALVARQTDASSEGTGTEPQTSAGGNDDNAPSTSAPPSPTSTPEPDESSSQQVDPSTSEPPQSSPTPDPTSSAGNDETSSVPQPSSSPNEEPSSSTEAPQSSTPSSEAPDSTPATSSGDESSTPVTSEPVTSTAFTTLTLTNSEGSGSIVTSAIATTTTDPDLADGNGNNNDGGLSPSNTKIVIGVVVGVGGAILLGALGVVAWRIRARKKLAEENDGLMDFDEAGKSEPGGTNSSPPQSQGQGTQRSPFQSTLDTYHQPTTVTASSNF